MSILPRVKGQERALVTARESVVRTVLVPVGSLVVAALGLLAKDVPLWVIVLAVAFIGVVLLAVLGDFLQWAGRKVRVVREERSLARRYFPEIRRFLIDLTNILSESRADSPFFVVKEASTLESQYRKKLADGRFEPQRIRSNAASAHLTTLWLCGNALTLVAESECLTTLRAVSGLTGQLLIQYQRYCEDGYEGIGMVLKMPEVPETMGSHLKAQWEETIQRHNHRMREWEMLAKRINLDVGEHICADHIPVLKGFS